MTTSYVLSIDQGTTSTRALVYNSQGQSLGSASQELPQIYPSPGWVEHDANQIWRTVIEVVPVALVRANVRADQITAIGLTNQRETSLFWDRSTGNPIGNALVWQDRRTADFCRERASDADWLFERTGLVLDPYFSATKLRWMLHQDADLKRRADAGDVAAGTIDSYLISRLSGGETFATDVTNASRTLLLDLKTAQWDEELCKYFDIPLSVLPDVRPSAGDFGVTKGLSFLPDGIPILGVAGDQQAALFGQCGFEPGDAKCTYGTGAFFLQHLGDQPILSKHRLITSLAATADGSRQYVMEGSIFIAGAAVQWLRDGLKLFSDSAHSEELAAESDEEQPVIFVPGLVGLGAPHWVPEAKGAIFGLTRSATSAELCRAALEGVAFQVVDLIEAAAQDAPEKLQELRVDGGMARNNWFLQRQADLLSLPVLQAAQSESTALGAAYLAGLQAKVWSDLKQLREMTAPSSRFEATMKQATREQKLNQWHRAVKAVIAMTTTEST